MKSLLVGLGNKVHCYLATRPEVEKALEFRVLWFLKKALPSGEEPDISLSIRNRKARALYVRNISPKRGSALNIRNDFIRIY